jgi:hypothetical protein
VLAGAAPLFIGFLLLNTVVSRMRDRGRAHRANRSGKD